MLWTTNLLGLSLMLPRMAWHLGIGRYVDTRDGSQTRITSRITSLKELKKKSECTIINES